MVAEYGQVFDVPRCCVWGSGYDEASQVPRPNLRHALVESQARTWLGKNQNQAALQRDGSTWDSAQSKVCTIIILVINPSQFEKVTHLSLQFDFLQKLILSDLLVGYHVLCGTAFFTCFFLFSYRYLPIPDACMFLYRPNSFDCTYPLTYHFL